jgi:hypothetical protein
MAAQKQIEIGICGLAVDFRRMRKEDREPAVWNVGCCLFDVVDPIVVRIVDAG